jgi:tetratricopeptide (TPR) repeat protein
MTRRRPMEILRIESVGLALLGAFVCSSLWGCAERADTPEVLVERGHLLENRGQYTEAIDAYTAALDHRPNDATIYYDRGVAYGRLNRWSEAADDYTRSIEHNGGTARAYNNRATAFAQLHDYKRAIEDFSQAIKLEPSAALSFRNRGLAYHDTNQLKEAIDDFTVAMGLEPKSFDGPFERANAYLEAREFQKAIEDFDHAIALDGSHAPAWANRSEAHRQLGNVKQAAADAAKAKQLDPNISITALEQASPPAKPSAVAPTANVAPPPQTKVALPDTNARREQALRVATAYLAGKGYHVEPAPAPFDLSCAKGAQRLRVEVQAPAAGQSTYQLTRQLVEATQHADRPTALVVVDHLTTPAMPGQPYTGGKVVKFEENWKPDQQKLVPLLYEYPRQ